MNDPNDPGAVDENYYYYYYSISTSNKGAGRLRYINGPWSYDSVYYYYDDAGRANRRKISTPSSYSNILNDVTVSLDTFGRPYLVTSGLGNNLIYYEGHSGLVDYYRKGNSQRTHYEYSSVSQGLRLEELLNDVDSNKTNGNSISEHSFTYYDSGRLKTWQRDAGSLYNQTYSMSATGSYDDRYRLKKVTQTGGGSSPFEYQYDYDVDSHTSDNSASADNRVSRKVGTTTYSYSVNTANQLTGHGMQYDGNGNLTAHTDPWKGKRYVYKWDAINRLTAIEVDNNGDGTFSSGDTRTEFFYNGAESATARWRKNGQVLLGHSFER